MTPAEVERSRQAQGFPARVEDVGVLAAVAAMADDARVERGDGDQSA